MLGEVFRRLALLLLEAKSSPFSGELGGDPCRLTFVTGGLDDVVLAIVPSELLANKVPFFGGRPMRLPVFENLVPPCTVDAPPALTLVGLTCDFAISLFSDEVSILSGLPFKGMILAGESFRIGGMASSKLCSLALKS